MSVSPKDQEIFRIDDKGGVYLPRRVLQQAGIEAKMRVQVRLDGKNLVIRKMAGGANPLDGRLGRKLDHDLFGKVAREQEAELQKARDLFDKGLADADDDDPEPPAHPFRWE